MFVVGWKVVNAAEGHAAKGAFRLDLGRLRLDLAAAVGLAAAGSAAADSAAAAGSAADAPAAAAPAEVGKRKDNVMTPEELVEQLEQGHSRQIVLRRAVWVGRGRRLRAGNVELQRAPGGRPFGRGGA